MYKTSTALYQSRTFNGSAFSFGNNAFSGDVTTVPTEIDEYNTLKFGTTYTNAMDAIFGPASGVGTEEPLNTLKLKCLQETITSLGPYCTVSGYYHRRNLLCDAAGQGKDITLTTGCTGITDCTNPNDTLVCGYNYEAMPMTLACDYIKMGLFNNYFTCTGDCFSYCPYKKCLDSFKTKQCTQARVCVQGNGRSYDSAQDFCTNNPNLTYDDIVPVVGSVSGSDYGNELDKTTCCSQESGSTVVCDSNNNYSVIPFFLICNDPAQTDAVLNASLFGDTLIQTDCDNFKACIEYGSLNFPACQNNGNYYLTKVDFCRENFNLDYAAQIDSGFRDCTGNNFCDSRLLCHQQVCEGIVTEASDIFCTENYDLLRTDKEICLLTTVLGLQRLQCSGSDCTTTDCLQKRNEELEEIVLPRCAPADHSQVPSYAAMGNKLKSDRLYNIEDFFLCGNQTCTPQLCRTIGQAIGNCETAFQGEVFPQCGDINGEKKLYLTANEICVAFNEANITANWTDLAWEGRYANGNEYTTDAECELVISDVEICEAAIALEGFTNVCSRDPDPTKINDPAQSKIYASETEYCQALVDNNLTAPQPNTYPLDHGGSTNINDCITAQAKIQCINEVTTTEGICHKTGSSYVYYANKNAYCQAVADNTFTTGFNAVIIFGSNITEQNDCDTLYAIATCEDTLPPMIDPVVGT